MISLLRIGLMALIATVTLCIHPQPAHAFCGFYVAKADTELYNQASQVAIARDGNHTVLTMGNDYQGEVSDFAMVVPVPTVITEDQVDVAESIVLDRLDAFSAPRLVEYFDSDPCQIMRPLANRRLSLSVADGVAEATAAPAPPSSLGVTIEEQFSVGEYDILILSAKESDGLETWLRQNQYQLPEGASEVLAPYIRQKMKFFVAKVNLDEFDSTGYQSLRPLQISYDSPKFMLPIRLGMLNADGDQDLIVYLLSPEGRIELTNYRTVNVPTDIDLPLFVQDDFGQVYPEMFQRRYEQENKNVAFLEYAWDMRSCDPCSAPVLTPEELEAAGVGWLDQPTPQPRRSGSVIAPPRRPRPSSIFISRLHVRYSRDKFPEDLMFQTTSNRQFFQGRYVTRHAFTGSLDCPARLREEYPDAAARQRLENQTGQNYRVIIDEAEDRGQRYLRSLMTRFEQESQNLARLTGRDIQEIRQRISDEVPQPTPSPWLIRYPKSS
ncbi:DUF2330 domain-containing protein [Leptothoe kymatousa]|uniref:DUF2330 domain-containing protein n=1 Tax=Leptothoe kymatousa TAU-MAC 1615 TaxID=2364775 RepID=A0ABS5Y185_9CYAN|nr:DUF2330 domain-containing protein [Leptothoe kymatousa]MBT9311573.1 DUF2330 domain-containing protein [Leptothoe kymatousa TAU-MAC 1615]